MAKITRTKMRAGTAEGQMKKHVKDQFERMKSKSKIAPTVAKKTAASGRDVYNIRAKRPAYAQKMRLKAATTLGMQAFLVPSRGWNQMMTAAMPTTARASATPDRHRVVRVDMAMWASPNLCVRGPDVCV